MTAMNKAKGITAGCVVFWALVLALKIPAVRDAYDRVIQAMTGVPVTEAERIKQRETQKSVTSLRDEPWGFPAPWVSGRSTGQASH
jgi:hypothetical protein